MEKISGNEKGNGPRICRDYVITKKKLFCEDCVTVSSIIFYLIGSALPCLILVAVLLIGSTQIVIIIILSTNFRLSPLHDL